MSKGSRAPTKIEDMDVDLTRFDWISLSFLISCIMDFHVCPQLLKEKNVILKHILGNFLDIRMAESLLLDMPFLQVPMEPRNQPALTFGWYPSAGEISKPMATSKLE